MCMPQSHHSISKMELSQALPIRTCRSAGTTALGPSSPASLKGLLRALFHTKGQLGSLTGLSLGKGLVMSRDSQ